MTRVDAWRNLRPPRLSFLASFGAVLLLTAIVLAHLGRSHKADLSVPALQPAPLANEVDRRAYSPAVMKPQVSAYVRPAGVTDFQAIAPNVPAEAEAGRRIVRGASIEMVVRHPAEVADQITALAEKLGGYLVSADGGENAATSTITVRVPATRFEEARTAIRELGLRVENEKFDAQDVTQQYVDQDATIRNLQAEEFGYLEILKQANNVNNMMIVAEKLSQVRGEIERKQAEFNSLTHQTETVAIAVSLRTEKEQQVFGLNWRPLYELKVAASDGLASLAEYASAMMTVLFFLPAALLWVGTFFFTAAFGWRAVRWVRRLWLGWTAEQNPMRG